MAQALSRRSVTAEACVRSPMRLREIYGKQSGTWAYIFPSASVSPCQYHSTMLHTYLVAVSGRTKERNMAIFHKAILFRNSGKVG
jgi:hypothetical protein